jgi:hypothetical protein
MKSNVLNVLGNLQNIMNGNVPAAISGIRLIPVASAQNVLKFGKIPAALNVIDGHLT